MLERLTDVVIDTEARVTSVLRKQVSIEDLPIAEFRSSIDYRKNALRGATTLIETGKQGFKIVTAIPKIVDRFAIFSVEILPMLDENTNLTLILELDDRTIAMNDRNQTVRNWDKCKELTGDRYCKIDRVKVQLKDDRCIADIVKNRNFSSVDCMKKVKLYKEYEIGRAHV